MLEDMTIRRMDNVLIVVDDLESAKAFFIELGMALEGETQVEGDWVDRTVGSKTSVPTSPRCGLLTARGGSS
jgi:hypothetical protein